MGEAAVYCEAGYCDYVLFGKDGSPLAVVEAKRTSKDPNVGRKQVMLYADCLERKFGRRPMMFTTNGFETYFWDDKTSPQRPVSGIFSKDDLQKMMNRRSEHKDLMQIPIDDTKNKDGIRLFTPAHFDLIIIDESHRSIFKKYRAIFEYFDAIMVGLTATPKTDVDRNTYDFFEMEHGVPTYAYDYETAVYQDHVLVPYYNYEVKTKFLDEGITYDDLSDKDKERYEDDFVEDGQMPEFIPSAAMQAFSEFINAQSLNQRQINFVHKIINHMEQNGYMENVAVLQKPPFDKPISFLKLFDVRTRTALMKAINDVRENAVTVAG